MSIDTAILIPCRLDSSRLKNKPLRVKDEKSLMWHTWMRACSVVGDKNVWILGDHRLLATEAKAIGANYIQTSFEVSGTKRCAKALREVGYRDVYINWQVDEPDIQSLWVEDLIHTCQITRHITTMAGPLDEKCRDDQNTVKVSLNTNNEAMWFSRQHIPQSLAHIGIYAFPGMILNEVCRHDQQELTKEYRLEQMDWLWQGHPIQVVPVYQAPISINSYADYQKWCKS